MNRVTETAPTIAQSQELTELIRSTSLRRTVVSSVNFINYQRLLSKT